MDCFVLASQKAEPFATTLIEAAMSGVPIVATDTGGTNEFLRHEYNGLLVAPGDTNQLAAALVRLKQKPSFAKKLADQAIKDAQKFSQEKFIKRFEKEILT
jgi:glycosyltransferase involved in cell wall biosynthesis